MADGGTPLDQQVAEAESLAARLPDQQRAIAAAEVDLTAADTADTRALAAWRRAQSDLRDATLPRFHAWRLLVTGAYPRTRDACRSAEADAEAATRAARDELRRRQVALDRLREQAGPLLAAAAALPGLRAARRLEQLRADGDPLSAAVDAVDADLRRTDDRIRELAEADAALAAASEAVRDAARSLDSAKSWGTYDTFFGGDLISSMVKHDRIDDSNADIRRVSSALATARRELADVDLQLTADPLEVDPFLKTTDIWFDNLFSDLAVQGRIGDHVRSIERLRTRLSEVRTRVGTDLRATREEREVLERRRAELLGGG